MKTRREVVKAALAAVPAIGAAQHHHPEEPLVRIAQPDKPKFFSSEQFGLLTRLTDLIIPRSETPGAADAGVPFRIDEAAGQRPALLARLQAGLAELDSRARSQHQKNFLELPEEQQIELLTPLSRERRSPEGRFFQLVKEMTIDAYYSTPEGLQQELGWHGNTYLPEFRGCTHPEHQG